ncbi:neurochondrin homolog [Folsomia candida]|uniref:Neurochondrin n=1 Tax=Folsomia candida TaxID=158441 RepID=A0A226DAX3_FOLCA|nr:neurochondrin homolog [Folsomia candida]OXA42705.1 Neurochondrin [Folsomia candida]
MSAKIDPAVQKCIGALQGAKNDTEKMAALFLVTKVVKGSKLTADGRNALFEAIGFKFLLRLLVSPSTPECPAVLYKSVALTILTTFCSDPKIAESKDMLDAVPIFLDIIEKADEEGDEEDDQLLQVVRESYHCLKSVASVGMGKDALVSSGAIPRLCELFANQAFNCDEALEIIATVGTKLKHKTWAQSPDSFVDIMDRLTLQFETDQSDQKFELCGLMAGIIPTSNITTEDFYTKFWPSAILKGLVDILSSKITEKQRNPALRLASVMLSTLGVDWIIKKTEQGPEAYQFLVLLVHLSCIEVRMALENRSLDKVMANDDLIGACYSIIETTVRFMSGTHFENLDEKQKEQVFHSLKGAYWAVLGFINQIQKEAMKNPRKFWDARKKLLTCASIRCLAAWLADEAASMKEDVYKILPFMLALAFETLQDDEDSLSPENQVLAEVGKCMEPLMPEVLVTLLPALCNFTAEERGVHMIMDSEGEQHLSRFLNHNWSVYKNLKEVLEKKLRPKKPGSKKGTPGEEELEMSQEEIKSTLIRLRVAMQNTCNIFINTTVLDPDVVATSSVFQQLMRWAFNAMPHLTNNEDDLPLMGNVASLGLLSLMNIAKKTLDAKQRGESISPEEDFITTQLISGSDNTAFRFGQAVVRFVWDAHLPDEVQSPPSLEITANYRSVWNEIKEMWFLSLQTVGGLLDILPWLADFCAESGFLEALIKNISLAYKSRIEQGTMSAYEDFLCQATLCKNSEKAASVLKSKGPALAKSHHLRALGKALKEVGVEL